MDAGPRSGAQIRADLEGGVSVSWRFIPDQKRLSIVLPEIFGGTTHQVCMNGGYTFEPSLIAVA